MPACENERQNIGPTAEQKPEARSFFQRATVINRLIAFSAVRRNQRCTSESTSASNAGRLERRSGTEPAESETRHMPSQS